MVNPGIFQGSRKLFLEEHRPQYAQAVANDEVSESLGDIQRRYFKHYPIELPLDQEPTQEFLAQVDDEAADDDDSPPEKGDLDDASFKALNDAYLDRGKLITKRKQQIARWFSYRYKKDNHANLHPKKLSGNDPVTVLMAKLTGIPIQKPRRRTAYNVWGPRNRHFVDPVFKERVAANNVPKKQHAALRSALYREIFYDILEKEEQKEWEELSVEEHKNTCDALEARLNAPPPTDPKDRQAILNRLPSFAQPILDVITAYTGWKATLMVGGPEPADNGRLNVISIHSGSTSGTVKQNFGHSERRPYKEYVVPVFAHFLKKCYTLDECRASALQEDSDGLSTILTGDSDINHDALDWNKEYLQSIGPHICITSNGVSARSSRSPTPDVSSRDSSPHPDSSLSPSPSSRSSSPSSDQDEVTQAPLPRSKKTSSSKKSQNAISRVKPRVPSKLRSSSSSSSNTTLRSPSPSDMDEADDEPTTSSVGVKIGPPRPRPRPVPKPITSAEYTPAPAPSHAPPSMSSPSSTPAPLLTPSIPPTQTPAIDSQQSTAPVPISNASKSNSEDGNDKSSEQPLPASSSQSNVAVAEKVPAVVGIPAIESPAVDKGGEIPTESSGQSAERAASSPPSPIPSRETSPVDMEITNDSTDSMEGVEEGGSEDGSTMGAGSLAVQEDVRREGMSGSQPEGFEATTSISDPSSPSDSSDENIVRSATVPPIVEESPVRRTSRSTSKRGRTPSPDPPVKRTRSTTKEAPAQPSTPLASSRKVHHHRNRNTGSTPAASSSTSITTSTPKYVSLAETMFSLANLGAQWASLVNAWIAFERKARFTPNGSLKPTGRPVCISDWIQRARSATWRPDLSGKRLEGLENGMVEWWSLLQPDGRVDDGGGRSKADTVDVQCLRRPGQNGLLSVMAGLFFWGDGVRREKESGRRKAADLGARQAAWAEILDDVAWVLARLAKDD